MDLKLKRGDVVEYQGDLYFFQPNGTNGLLYLSSSDVGIQAKAVLNANRRHFKLPDQARKDAFVDADDREIVRKRKNAVPLRRIVWDSEDESETEETSSELEND